MATFYGVNKILFQYDDWGTKKRVSSEDGGYVTENLFSFFLKINEIKPGFVKKFHYIK